MKKLDRQSGETPHCLEQFRANKRMWGDLTRKNKGPIWRALKQLQDDFCAYCESLYIVNGTRKAHIEHFRDKTAYEHLTYEWSNLFACCENTEHCGHYKDRTLAGGQRRVYDPDLLIKPDEDEPLQYLQYLVSGDIVVKLDISQQEQARANETIEVFNLTHSRLINSRREVIERFMQRLKFIAQIEDPQLFEQEYRTLLNDIEQTKHRAAVKSVLLG